MGRVTFLSAVLLTSLASGSAPSDDLAATQKALIEAVTTGHNDNIKSTLDRLVAFNNAKCIDVLIEAYRKTQDLLKVLEKEMQKTKKDMDDNEVKYDTNGIQKKGNSAKYLKAKNEYEEALRKDTVLGQWFPLYMRYLLKLNSEDAAAGLIAKMQSGPDWYVRAHAALALSKIDSKEALAALLETGKKEQDPGVRIGISDALAKKAASEESRLLLESYVADDCWQVRLSAMKALAVGANRNSIAPVIESLKNASGRMRYETNEVLKKLTGVDKHGEYTAWKEWYEKNKDEVLAGTYKPKPLEAADAKGGSTFYGVEVTSNRILFMLDISQSMYEEAAWKPEDKGDEPLKGNGRMDVAQHQLRKLVKSLPDSVEFNIMLFDRGQKYAFPKMERATKSSRDKAVKFIDAIQMGDGTWTFVALTKAFELASGPFPNARVRSDSYDTLYVISDGEPSSGLQRYNGFIDRIVAYNQFRKIVIHGVGIEAPPWGEEILKGLAEATGGMWIKR